MLARSLSLIIALSTVSNAALGAQPTGRMAQGLAGVTDVAALFFVAAGATLMVIRRSNRRRKSDD
jgi:hypothetical protein